MSWARYVDILGGETSTSSGSDQAFYNKKNAVIFNTDITKRSSNHFDVS